MSAARIDVSFPSGDDRCAAWFYPAASGEPAPILVLAHGLGGTRELRLDAFAERFQEAGYAALVFDYRHFGSSSGEPRQLLSIRRQRDDWAAAAEFARTLDGVDPARVVLWGTSFSGGHVIRTAVRDQRVAAVIAQCPFTDGLASMRRINPRTSMRLTVRALRDLAAMALRREPVTVPLTGRPGDTALMTAPDVIAGYRALIPEGHTIRESVAARIALAIPFAFPGRSAAKLTCPALFVVCDSDTVAPARATVRHVRKAPRSEIVHYDEGHFDIYVGEPFERNIADQLEFLVRSVPVGSNA